MNKQEKENLLIKRDLESLVELLPEGLIYLLERKGVLSSKLGTLVILKEIQKRESKYFNP